MTNWKHLYIIAVGFAILVAATFAFPSATLSQGSGPPPNYLDSPNGNGVSRTLTTARIFDTTNPFFKPLGTNGRSCATCHPISQGMTISPDYATQVFLESDGLDPLFAPVDGTNSPNANRSTLQARRVSSSMLLNKGLIRIGRVIPTIAEFSLAAVDDPYRYASAKELSCFRLPLPATNLRFLATILPMWAATRFRCY
jgi:cytochrome c peroxidase